MHRNSRLTLVWILLAGAVTCGAVWQAREIWNKPHARHHAPLAPPVKTKRAERPSTAFTGDVVADYQARCAKGMTDQEILWILEDFRQSGPSQSHPWDDYFEGIPSPSPTPAELESFLTYTHSFSRWYSEILRDGFRLSREQSAELTRNLARQLDKSQTTFIGFLKNGFPKTDPSGMGGEWTEHWTPWSNLLLDQPECQPWNLCSLTPAQEKISWKLTTQAIDRGEVSYSDPYPFDASLNAAEDRDLFLYFHSESRFFPFLKDQKLVQKFGLEAADSLAPADRIRIQKENRPRITLENARHLHPAQLKSWLLFESSVAEELQQALDADAHSLPPGDYDE